MHWRGNCKTGHKTGGYLDESQEDIREDWRRSKKTSSIFIARRFLPFGRLGHLEQEIHHAVKGKWVKNKGIDVQFKFNELPMPLYSETHLHPPFFHVAKRRCPWPCRICAMHWVTVPRANTRHLFVGAQTHSSFCPIIQFITLKCFEQIAREN